MESEKGLTEEQDVLLQLLMDTGLDETLIIAIMLLLKDDTGAMMGLSQYIYDNRPTTGEIMKNWVMGYLRAHPQKRKG